MLIARLLVLGFFALLAANGWGDLHPGNRGQGLSNLAGQTRGAFFSLDAGEMNLEKGADIPGDSPEAMLAAIFSEIRAQKLDGALEITEELLKRHPNYRLANLIKGDLLLAKAQGIESFGAMEMIPREQVNELESEAQVRLRRYLEKPPADRLPRYLLHMSSEQKYAIVVDAERSRLYLFKNQNGFATRVTDFYTTLGKRGLDKFKQGDKKTPLGIYRVTAAIPKESLINLYGSAAFPLNYPNELDALEGRQGNGIWLHGTPAETFARPPEDSNGCIVLVNEDINRLAGYLQKGITPVIVSRSVEWVSGSELKKESDRFAAVLESWRNDLQSQDKQRLLAHYSRNFRSGDLDYQGLAAQKLEKIAVKASRRFDISNLSVLREPERDNLITVQFDQDYVGSDFSSKIKKTQYWRQEKEGWKIVYESR